MVMTVNPIMRAVKSIKKKKPVLGKDRGSRVILFSAKGKKLTQSMARRLSKYEQLVLICGRYEGVDERVAKYIADEEISIGDYVLFGGEVPAMVVIEAVSRLIPGTIAKEKSVEEESFKQVRRTAHDRQKYFIEYPHYTRPEIVKIENKKRQVPKLLLTGNHKKIQAWRVDQAKKMAIKRNKLNESSR
jgi:tRNA (guanine37-N1)-methyltransferase